MSNISPVTTFSDLYTDFLNRARDSTSVSATTVLAKRYINTGLLDMHLNPGGTSSFPWVIRRGVLITHAPYTTGTISITAAARTTVTGSATLWNTAVTGFGFNNARTGGKMKLGSQNEIYNVSAVGGDTSITLESVYTGDALTDSSYVYFEDEYALASDFGKPVDWRLFSSDLEIPLIGASDFRRLYVRNENRGKPKVASLIQLGFSGTTAARYRVVLSPAPDDEYSIPYNYVTTNLAVTAAGAEQSSLVNDTDEPIVPLKYRSAIVFHALYHWYRDYKDDVRSQEAKMEYMDIIKRMCGDLNIGQDKPRLVVAQKFGRRNTWQRFDYGGRFDQIRDRYRY